MNNNNNIIISSPFDGGGNDNYLEECDAIKYCLDLLEKRIPTFIAEKVQLRTVYASYTRFAGFDSDGRELYDTFIKGTVTLVYLR